jgi:hypothetical protein
MAIYVLTNVSQNFGFQPTAHEHSCSSSIFQSYCRKALERIPQLTANDVEEMLAEVDESSWKSLAKDGWKKVLAFYLLRLCAAPVVETILLLDRMFFLFENGSYHNNV